MKLTEELVKTLFEKIGFIANACNEGEDFDGCSLENNDIVLSSSTHFDGCGIETFNLYVSISDLASKEAVEIIDEILNLRILRNEEAIEAERGQKLFDEKNKIEKEKAEYHRLKNKYG